MPPPEADTTFARNERSLITREPAPKALHVVASCFKPPNRRAEHRRGRVTLETRHESRSVHADPRNRIAKNLPSEIVRPGIERVHSAFSHAER